MLKPESQQAEPEGYEDVDEEEKRGQELKRSRFNIVPVQESPVEMSFDSPGREKKAEPKFGKTLFEEYMILGVDRSDIIKIDSEGNEMSQTWAMEPKVLYSFPKHDHLQDW